MLTWLPSIYTRILPSLVSRKAQNLVLLSISHLTTICKLTCLIVLHLVLDTSFSYMYDYPCGYSSLLGWSWLVLGCVAALGSLWLCKSRHIVRVRAPLVWESILYQIILRHSYQNSINKKRVWKNNYSTNTCLSFVSELVFFTDMSYIYWIFILLIWYHLISKILSFGIIYFYWLILFKNKAKQRYYPT